MEVQELEIFVAVVKNGNFSKTADELAIAASVVSRSIQKLENKLKVKLFNRTTRKMSLTQEGDWLYQQAADIIDRVSQVESHFNNVRECPQGVLRVDAATSFALHAIAPVIPEFKRKYNQVKIILTSSDSIVDLIERKVDVAIRIGTLTDSTLKARKLGNSYRKVYASPDYLQASVPIRSVSDLYSHACLGFAAPEKLNTWPLQRECGGWFKAESEVIADNGEALKQLAIEGCGFACLSTFVAEQDVRTGRLICVLEEQTQMIPVPIYAVFCSGNENVRLRRFLDHLVEHIYLG